jgi:hypothetical protein
VPAKYRTGRRAKRSRRRASTTGRWRARATASGGVSVRAAALALRFQSSLLNVSLLLANPRSRRIVRQSPTSNLTTKRSRHCRALATANKSIFLFTNIKNPAQGRRCFVFPSPLAGEVLREREQAKRVRARATALSPPHPARAALRAALATLSRKGRGKMSVTRKPAQTDRRLSPAYRSTRGPADRQRAPPRFSGSARSRKATDRR